MKRIDELQKEEESEIKRIELEKEARLMTEGLLAKNKYKFVNEKKDCFCIKLG